MYLLDINVWLWMVEKPVSIPKKMVPIVNNSNNYPFALSAISVWEVAKKVSLGKLGLSIPITDWIKKATDSTYIQILPLSIQVSVESTQLPGEFHKDPADQIIVATARLHNLTILTADRLIHNYPHVKTVY
ncbi:MAG: type II toxin-antitoxin system VapC family toxin [Thermodesulfobacteriota bacterium]|nr:type II toxin-antitoxin system VapC family toxin [Thermodesulfobacteriota bacterium]